MYEAQAELLETRQELERIRRERDELKNQMTINNVMKIVDDCQRNNSDRFEAIEENLRRLTTTVSNNDGTFVEIKETLKDLKETIQVQKENEKSLADDHSKLSGTVGAIELNLATLSVNVSDSDKILSRINENLKKQNNDIQIPKNNMKTMEKETILLVGGWDGTEKVNTLQILQNNEESNGNWKELNIKLPYAVKSHGAQFLNNCLYIFGGEDEKNEILDSSYKLRGGHKWLTRDFKWEKMANMNEKRKSISSSSVVLNYRIWVMGGWNGKEVVKSVEMYDPQRNIWVNMTEMNECRNFAAAAVANGKIFCCGGYNGNKFLRSAEYYDPSYDVWTFISDIPGPNGACGIVEMDAHLIVIGGRAAREKDYLNSVWVLDTTEKNGKWIEKEPRLSHPRSEFSIAKIDDKIFVCGGIYINQEDSKTKCTNDVEIFDGEVWRNGSKLTTFLCNTVAVVVPMKFARSLS